ncbi:RelA/SpoT domain-containing protein [Saccharopolyspora phatthalungensis]|uniref:RelA/SpoT domain-containing protein n=1 Tax=Saccharopolyspora phatthalungensis TaxID=664693 RepID=A0A840Q7T7_9PSEU|nr:RelA/SpoT domain-containing protein [Saccharopolyspora phatthalungensis]MBB5154699.1 hypothetical protein [Saccharopolyspora phatthalungensis]
MRGPQVAPKGSLPSKTQINLVGNRLRKMVDADSYELLDSEAVASDKGLLQLWRAVHQPPLLKLRITLQRVVSSELGPAGKGKVNQRLKTAPSIVAKLARLKTRLAEMEDLGGCRATLPDMETLTNIRERLLGTASLNIDSTKGIKDYTGTPQIGGYRAVHLVARRDGCKIEIQLRTQRQQDWAQDVESWDSEFGFDLKHQNAPDNVVRLFRLLSDVLWYQDCGEQVPSSMLAELDELQDLVEFDLLEGGHGGL